MGEGRRDIGTAQSERRAPDGRPGAQALGLNRANTASPAHCLRGKEIEAPWARVHGAGRHCTLSHGAGGDEGRLMRRKKKQQQQPPEEDALAACDRGERVRYLLAAFKEEGGEREREV